MKTFTFKTKGVCSREIRISIHEGRVESVSFKSGCEGNLQAIGRLVQGMMVEEVIKRLKGIDCEGKGTSCPDQLSRALEAYLKSQEESIA
jgi:uncharacterized protein (TIGR03905 family)